MPKPVLHSVGTRTRLQKLLDALLAESGSSLQSGRLYLLGRAEDMLAGLVRIITGEACAVVRIPRQTRVATCTYCGLEILFVQNGTGKGWIAVDRRPLQIISDDGTVHRGREAHAATCAHRDRLLAERASARHKAEAAKEGG